jgi:16S rRNA processing protein RimM
MEERLAIGLIRTSHGVKGNLKVKSFSGETSHFFRLKKVYIKKGDRFIPYRVESAGGSHSSLLLKLESIDTREEAFQLRGEVLWVDRSDASPLKQGEYYYADLSRCNVYHEGKEIGRVNTVIEGGVADILEIVTLQGKTIMIPFDEHFIAEINMEEKGIYLNEDFVIP